MAYEVKMPKFGETMNEGTILNWLKSEGEKIEEGEPLFEVETDKASLEVEAPEGGILGKIIVQENESTPIGEIVALITEEGEKIEASEKSKESEVKENKTEELNEGIKTENVEVKKQVEQQEKSQEKKQVNFTEKIKASPAARTVANENGISLEEVTIQGDRDAIIKADVVEYLNESPKLTPVARKMVREYELDPEKISGTGPEGRITRKDIENYRKKENVPETSGQEVPLTNIRKIIGERMSQSSRQAPHVTLTMEANMEEVVNLRKRLLELTDIHITYTDMLAFAVIKALKDYPEMNCHYQDEKLIIQGDINIGIAVDIEEGLVVPVIKNTAGMGLENLAQEREKLAEKARGGNLTADEMKGGTFTISNLGNFGIEIFTPIINPPEIGILGVGQIKEKPVVENGDVVVKPMMWLSLSFDHRAIDGAPASEFLALVKELLENPGSLLL